MPYVSPFKSNTGSTGPVQSGLGYVSPFKNSVFTAEYAAEQQAIRQRQSKIDDLNRVLQTGDIQKISNSLRTARAEGVIDQAQQINILKQIEVGNQANLKAQLKDIYSLKGITGTVGETITGGVKAIGEGLASAYTTAGTGLGEALGYKQTSETLKAQQAQQQQATDTIIALTKQKQIATNQATKDRIDQAIKTIESNRQQTAAEQSNRLNELTYNIDPVRNAAAIAEIGMDILTAGQFVGAKTAAKIGMTGGKLFTNSLAKSLAKVSAKGLASASAKKTLNIVAENAVKQGIPGALAGALSAIEQKGAKATAQDIFIGATTGGALGTSMGAISGAMTAKQVSKLEQSIQKAKLGDDIMPELSTSKIDQLRGKVEVSGENIVQGVDVKVVRNLTEEEYVKAVDKLGKEYDKAIKATEKMGPLKREVVVQNLDDKYQASLAKLDEMKTAKTISTNVSAQTPTITTTPISEVPRATKPIETPQVTKTIETPVKTIKTSEPVGQLPVSSSDQQLKSAVYERMKAENPDVFTDELTRGKMNMDTEIDNAINFVNKDKNKAYKVAMGIEKSNEVMDTAVNGVMVQKALSEGDNELAMKLTKKRSLDLTRKGQDISLEKAFIKNNSPDRYMREYIDMRLQSVKGANGKKSNAIKIIDEQVKVGMEKLSKAEAKSLDISAAQKLLERITCK